MYENRLLIVLFNANEIISADSSYETEEKRENPRESMVIMTAITE
jgi:hypothetical protein